MLEIKSAMAVACLCLVDWTYRLRGMDWFPFVNDRINVRTHVCIYLFLTIEDIIYEICIINVILILQLIGKDWIHCIRCTSSTLSTLPFLFHFHFSTRKHTHIRGFGMWVAARGNNSRGS